MIKSIRVINSFGDDPLDLVLTSSHIDEGIYVKSITGIGPETSNINTTPYATEDGGVFNSARSEDRNIVLTLGFYESEKLQNTIEDSRQKTYKYFPKKKQITLIFYTDNRTSFINGYVESNTPDIFSDAETTQISVICPDPNFYSVRQTTSRFGGVTGYFEFPFSHDVVGQEVEQIGGIAPTKQEIVSDHMSITGEAGIQYFERTSEDNIFNEWVYLDDVLGWYQTNDYVRLNNATLILGEISQGSVHQVNYKGEADAPCTITFHFLGEATNITFQNVETGEIIKFDTSKIAQIVGSSIISGDDIVLTTSPSAKGVVFERNGVQYDILSAIDKNYLYNCWFKLHKGINQFTFIADSGFDNIKITIESYTAFDGV